MAIRASSAGNLQPWFFVVAGERKLREGLARAAGLLLAVVSLGLGACWVGAFDERAVRLPSGLRPVALNRWVIPRTMPAVAAGGRWGVVD